MTDQLSPADAAKRVAALRAAEFVEDGMKVGLGTGSTAAWLVRVLGALCRDEGLQITAVPTSRRTAEQAKDEGIRIVTLDEAGWLDLTIDGADEIDGDLNLIKGGGGALLHEKVVATASDRMVVIADPSKEVETLGAFPLPVEILEFGQGVTRRLIEELLADHDVQTTRMSLRDEGAFRTDEGNLILDLHLERIGDPTRLARELNRIPGVVENGLFIDIADVVVIGDSDGRAVVHGVTGGAASATRRQDNLFRDIEE